MLDGGHALGRGLASLVGLHLLRALSRLQRLLRREAALFVQKTLRVVGGLSHHAFTVFVDHKISVLLALATSFCGG